MLDRDDIAKLKEAFEPIAVKLGLNLDTLESYISYQSLQVRNMVELVAVKDLPNSGGESDKYLKIGDNIEIVLMKKKLPEHYLSEFRDD